MPDYTQFIKYFNEYPNIPPSETSAYSRLADTTWRLLTATDKESTGTKASSRSDANITTGPTCPPIVVGRLLVSTEDRWRIQAHMRREEAKAGAGRKEYNKKVTRAAKPTKGPAPGEGFPPGRGRPV
ncbi:uncharacterized protein TEOVI_000764700 [Trypanosoma equiperdum]|uniref:Uncharacterized protein n=4 Tax=Trypanozoon TaxID=39700 RepID=Q38EN4_TRYB2|nr:hypothetical protein, conserved [Trypanosoma brucei gambiense DAL972]XP_827066.1 hypothetical protein, conserved [Trypanosoma brucei brucei TREU927]RHW70179.1 hypothetical protein DPX39_090035900 [Trypanosoma brucei equiperdum]SCU64944.1 hypothetical protein, conserved [Trypanosoma equiperdum]EAN76736.1 hypothetical protein, conserved [Trypanosoma brucei brucei TREU927]CBH14302.1 hypothetical protein, conserved [Trypanosoma brucei gambiense DAL972]|eukprot:XP_011776572.1 hypothetical protein, conserved [Trypanosoma brucei gambiense DAL972]